MAMMVKVKISCMEDITINFDKVLMIKEYRCGTHIYLDLTTKMYIPVAYIDIKKILERWYE